MYLYATSTYVAKYQFSINKQEHVDLKHFNNSKVFIEYSKDMDDIRRNIEEYDPKKT